MRKFTPTPTPIRPRPIAAKDVPAEIERLRKIGYVPAEEIDPERYRGDK